MSRESRITQAQEAVLARYTCERLTADPRNRMAATNFFCSRNPHLAHQLQCDAWYEDRESRPTVYYVVKNAQGQIAMYFSLRCGVLFDPDYVRDAMERYDHDKELVEALENGAWERVESLRGGIRFSRTRKQQEIRSHYNESRRTWRSIKADKRKEPNEKMIRVDEAFPAIELVHFCVNDLVRGQWKSYNIGHPMGECLFWYFVVPKMQEINALVGCEYAYLFAADGSRDGTLINYYETALHFERMTQIGAIKPEYDFFCIFMGKRLNRMTPYRRNCLAEEVYSSEDELGLSDYRERFFEYFNIVPGEEIV